MLDVSNTLGINIGNTLAFDASAEGARTMSQTYACATNSYMKGIKKGKLQAAAMFSPEMTDGTDSDSAIDVKAS